MVPNAGESRNSCDQFLNPHSRLCKKSSSQDPFLLHLCWRPFYLLVWPRLGFIVLQGDQTSSRAFFFLKLITPHNYGRIFFASLDWLARIFLHLSVLFCIHSSQSQGTETLAPWAGGFWKTSGILKCRGSFEIFLPSSRLCIVMTIISLLCFLL